MQIRPSAAIRQDYNKVSKLCKETGEPVFLTKNGEGDLVVMDIETYKRHQQVPKISSDLLRIKEDELKGTKYLSLDEVDRNIKKVLNAVIDEKSNAV